MNWAMIVSTLLSILAPKLPGWVLALLKSWLGTLTPPTIAATVGDAPDELKSFVRKFLLDSVEGIKMPFVKLVLKRVIESLSDSTLDLLWNRLVPGKAVPLLATAEADFIDFDALVTECVA